MRDLDLPDSIKRVLLYFGVILWFWIMLSPVEGAEKPPKLRVGKDSTSVTMNNRQTLLGLAPMRVRIVARIEAPTPEWFCPSMEVTWANATKAFRESDCDPLEEQEQPIRPWVSEAIVGWLGEGRHDIGVRLKQGGEEMQLWLQAELR